MKLKELLSTPFYQTTEMTGKELRAAYKSARDLVRGRLSTFEKHGRIKAVPERFRSGLPSLRDMSDAQVKEALGSVTAWMRGRSSTYRGWSKNMEERIDELNEQLKSSPDDPDIIQDLDDFDRYGKFMEEMQTRYKSSWKAYASAQAKEIYGQAIRLNADPRAFMKNFEYWADHLEDLEGATPLVRSRAVRPSDYIKQLKLPGIRASRK